MEDILEMDEETLNLNDELEILSNWDSLAMLAFIAMIDEHYEVSLATDDMTSCVTVDDLANLVERACKN
jgi:acyl carrier protein